VCLAVALLFTQACNRGADTAAQNGGGNGKKGGKKKGGRGGGDFGPVPVVVAKVVRKDMPLELNAVGNVEPYSVVSIRPQVGGQLQEVFIQDGEYVKKGQKLFQIDSRPLDAQVAQVEATLARDRAQLGQVTANLARDSANEKYAREQAARYVTLFQEGVVSRDDRDRFAANADALTQLVEADKAAIQSAQAQIQADQANLANIKLQLSFTTIFSPLDGRAGNVSIKAGNIVTANQTELMSISQTQPIYVTFSIPESRLDEVQRYMTQGKLAVEAQSQDGLAKPEHGTMTFVDNTVDTTTGTIKLKGTFPNGTRALWPGEYVNVMVRLSTLMNVMVIPPQVMQTGQSGTYAYVVGADRTVEMRPITPGLRRENELVISQGLTEGETVVTEGQLRLAPGSRVTLPGENGRGGGGGGRGGRGKKRGGDDGTAEATPASGGA
jgi:membrane fusion protein, multidrug efflux system